MRRSLLSSLSSRRHSARLCPLLVASLCLSESVAGLRIGSRFPARRLFSMVVLDSPSAQRNKEPIWGVLSQKVLPSLPNNRPLTVVEVAAGCGVHTEYFAKQLSQRGQPFRYYATDPDARSLESIEGRRKQAQLEGVESPLPLTLNADGIVESETDAALNRDPLDLIFCINMIHISPWDATRGLMKFAGDKLRSGGVLFCYGPYKVGGTAVESNLDFDQSLRMRDPSWGVRNLEDVAKEASDCGLAMVKSVEMPANNLSVLFVKN